jgi:hypothetical protein
VGQDVGPAGLTLAEPPRLQAIAPPVWVPERGNGPSGESRISPNPYTLPNRAPRRARAESSSRVGGGTAFRHTVLANSHKRWHCRRRQAKFPPFLPAFGVQNLQICTFRLRADARLGRPARYGWRWRGRNAPLSPGRLARSKVIEGGCHCRRSADPLSWRARPERSAA